MNDRLFILMLDCVLFEFQYLKVEKNLFISFKKIQKEEFLDFIIKIVIIEL